MFESFKGPAPRVGKAAIAAIAGGCAIFVVAFFAGRLTASSKAASLPTLAPVHARSAAIALPQLSQAAPLPALAAAAKAAVQAPVTQVPTETPTVEPIQIQTPVITKTPTRASTRPVRIVGSG